MAGHEGHRERMKKRFLRYGLDSFDDHNALELLLFYAQPRQDTNETAHLLLDTFGSLERVFDAEPEELMTVKGVKENAAALIRLVMELSQRCRAAKDTVGTLLPDAEAMGKYLIPRFMNCKTETVLMLCLDPKLKLLDCRQISSGGLTSAQFSVRRIVQLALMQNACYAVLAHNHPSGIALPSPEDQAATIHLRNALAAVDVELLDHIIVAGEDFVSLKEDGVFDIKCSFHAILADNPPISDRA